MLVNVFHSVIVPLCSMTAAETIIEKFDLPYLAYQMGEYQVKIIDLSWEDDEGTSVYISENEVDEQLIKDIYSKCSGAYREFNDNLYCVMPDRGCKCNEGNQGGICNN